MPREFAKSRYTSFKTIKIICALCFCSVITLSCKTKSYTEKKWSFSHGNDKLAGRLIIPNKASNTLVVFVHGDGAIPYDAYGFYKPIWETLAEQGIASFSWDKPGVKRSSGNWLQQSMLDRASEVQSAITSIRSSKIFNFQNIGAMGFSQAGWVLPKLDLDQSGIDFLVFYSTSVNWQNQSLYMTRRRLEQLGLKANTIREELVRERQSMPKLFGENTSYDNYLVTTDEKHPMSPERFGFVKRNYLADAYSDLQRLSIPVLVLHGEEDLNVDGPLESKTYSAALSDNSLAQIKVYPNATHQLTRSDLFNTPTPGFWELMKLEVKGQAAFVDNVLVDLSKWIKNQEFKVNP